MNRIEHITAKSTLGLIALILIMSLGMNRLGFAAPADDLEQAKAAARVQDFTEAARLLKPLAEQGHTDAQFQLAGLFRSGRGVAKNHKTAVFWLRKAARQEHAEAQYQLGVMYEQGWGTKTDTSLAIKWYQTAAMQGSEMAWKRFKALKQLEAKREKDPGYKRNQALREAVAAGRAQEMERLIQKGADINAPDAQGQTPLILAVENGQSSAVKVLLQSDADLTVTDASGNNPLLVAAHRGDFKSTYLLVQAGINVNSRDRNYNTPLHLALAKRNFKMTQTLVHLGAGVDVKNRSGQTAVQLAQKSNDKKIRKIIQSAQEMEHVRIAVREKSFSKAARLLQSLAGKGNAEAQYQLAGLYRSGQGVAKNYKIAAKWFKKSARQDHTAAQYNLGIMYENGWGVTASRSKAKQWFQKASVQGYQQAESKLEQLETENVSLSKSKLNLELFEAVHQGNTENVQHLLVLGADVNHKDSHGRTPLMEAVEMGHTEVTKVLIRSGAQVQAINRVGDNPLHIAAGGSHPKIVKLLIDARVPLNAKDRNGNTPLIIATMKGNRDTAKILIQNGAKLGILKTETVSAWLRLQITKKHKVVLRMLLAHGAVLEKDERKTFNTAVLKSNASSKTQVGRFRRHAQPYQGWPPLMVAAWRGQKDLVRALLKSGASVDDVDEQGHTALSRAALKGPPRRSSGYAPRIKERSPIRNSSTAKPLLFWAAEHGHTKVVQRIGESGRPGQCPAERRKHTALIYAIQA